MLLGYQGGRQAVLSTSLRNPLPNDAVVPWLRGDNPRPRASVLPRAPDACRARRRRRRRGAPRRARSGWAACSVSNGTAWTRAITHAPARPPRRHDHAHRSRKRLRPRGGGSHAVLGRRRARESVHVTRRHGSRPRHPRQRARELGGVETRDATSSLIQGRCSGPIAGCRAYKLNCAAISTGGCRIVRVVDRVRRPGSVRAYHARQRRRSEDNLPEVN